MGKFIDLTGQRFGRLTVIEKSEKQKNKTMWLCECDCGKQKKVSAENLKIGKTRSCGCYRREVNSDSHFEDLTGQMFGKLTVIEQAERRNGQIAWRCQCACGNETTVITSSLKKGHTKSCGCLRKENVDVDMIGQKFGRLTVIKRVEEQNGALKWLCKCDCGNEKIVAGSHLKDGSTKSCGCYSNEVKHRKKCIDLIGKKFGRLTVIERAENKGRQTAWLCHCDCGNSKIINAYSLKSGRTRSCGCIAKEQPVRHTAKDLTGRIFGKLTVIERVKNRNNRPMWRCLCECNNMTIVPSNALCNGHTTSCGCNKYEYRDLTGLRFGRLTVVERADKKGCRIMWLCKCDCGNSVVVSGENLKRKNTTSCGCYAREHNSELKLVDLTGKRFGVLTVIKRANNISNRTAWVCKCDCGNVISTTGTNLTRGNSKSCGCVKSTGEYNTIKYLNSRNVKYEVQKKFDGLFGVDGGKLSYDFFLPDYSVLIECQGQQHYFPVDWFGGEEKFKIQIQHDKRKREYALDHGYELLEIPYSEYENIDTVLESKMRSLQL